MGFFTPLENWPPYGKEHGNLEGPFIITRMPKVSLI
jgi:hypothetical protein